MSLSRSDTTVIRLARARTSPARRAPSSQRRDSLSLLERSARGPTLPLSRLRTLMSASPRTSPERASTVSTGCSSTPPRLPPLPTGPKPLARTLAPPRTISLGVLDRQNVAPRRPISGALGRRRAQPRNRHGLIAQKAPETNLGAPPAAGNLAHARTRARDKRGVTQGPLFSSRSSPNPPTPYRSTSTALKSIIGSRICPCSESEFVKKLKEKMCASNSRKAGRRGCATLRVYAGFLSC